MPGPILLSLLRISTLGSQAKNICLPPRGVIDVSVCGSAPCRPASFASSATPSSCLAGSTSGSRTHTPLTGPVGAPIIAFGHFPHHARICVSSAVASLKPCGVSGFLSSGLHGKTGRPLRAYSSASGSADGLGCVCGGIIRSSLCELDEQVLRFDAHVIFPPSL